MPIRLERGLPVSEAVQIARQILEGFNALHGPALGRACPDGVSVDERGPTACVSEDSDIR